MQLECLIVEVIKTMNNNRRKILFDNMAQYIFEQLANACMAEEDIKEVFTDELGFTNEEYKQEIGEGEN